MAPVHWHQVERDPARVPREFKKKLQECSNSGTWPLYCFGPVGTGKTCAALCVVDHVEHSRYHTVSELTEQFALSKRGRLMSNSVNPTSLSYKDYCGILRSIPLLVIDEVGSVEGDGRGEYEAIKTVCELRDTSPLILMGNIEPQELPSIYDDRLASRCLRGGNWFEFAGDDQRTT